MGPADGRGLVMSGDYEVGDGKPPKQHQFQKGQSGNPRGKRQKEARSVTARQIRRDFLRALETEIEATVPGRAGKVTVAEAIIWKQLLQAMKGDYRSAKLVLEWRREFTQDHMRAHPDLMDALEAGEQMHGNSETSTELNHHSTRVYNELRKMTQKI